MGWRKEVARLFGTDPKTLHDMFNMYSNHKAEADEAFEAGVTPKHFVDHEPSGFLDAIRYARQTDGKG